MALRLVPNILNPVDMIPSPRKALAVVDPKVPQITDIQCIVATPPLRIHNTPGATLRVMSGARVPRDANKAYSRIEELLLILCCTFKIRSFHATFKRADGQVGRLMITRLS